MNRRSRVRRRQLLQSAAATAAAAFLRGGGARAAPPIKPRLVVVGGGFAGSACALQLRALLPAAHIRLVDPAARYATCPTSNEVIVGWRALGSIQVDRDGLERAGIEFVAARVAAIDAATRRVRLADGSVLPYDRAVVAPGIRLLWDRIPGYGPEAAQRMPHAWQAGAQTELLAAQLAGLRDGGIVAICVPAGLMRCPPAPYERASLIASVLHERNPRSKILIFDANNRFPRQERFSAAWQSLYPGMIDWIAGPAGGSLERVDPATMTLHTGGGAQAVDIANVIAPQAPGEIAAATGLAAEHGWCPVDPRSFESTHLPGVHVIGDACIADAMPKSASAAVSQAQQCAAAIAAALRGAAAPAPQLASICYAKLAATLVLAMPGRFAEQEGRIVALPDDDAGGGLPASVAAAAAWYEAIRRDAFRA